MKKTSGFTLVELMIVIAVIGILAVVLIPKLSTAKDSAKNAGVFANLRVVQSTLESMINDYNSDETGATQLRNDLITKLDGKLKNPFTGNMSALINWTGTDCAVGILGGATTRAAADTSIGVWVGRAGRIHVEIYVNQGTLEASLYAYDKTGTSLTTASNQVRVIK